MAEDELKLTVTLVDNATPQLGRIRGAMNELGGSGVHNALRESHKHTQNLGSQIGKLGHDVEHVAKHILPSFITGIGGAATGFLALGLAGEKALDSIKEFSKEMVGLDRVAKDTGLSAGQIKNMVEVFQRAGVSAGQAQNNIRGFASAVSDILTRVGSERRQELMKRAAGDAEAMQRWLTGLRGKDMEEIANEVKEKS